MSHRWFTALILVLAVVFYVLGSVRGGTALLVAGCAFELWFWIRLYRTSGSGKSASSSKE